MANKRLFNSKNETVTMNEAGGAAYKLTNKQALAQIAVTGCLNNTFYASSRDQLDKVRELANSVDNEFLAKVAIYARKHGFMKDMPALLAAILSAKEKNSNGQRYFPVVFNQVCDNSKMIRNFVQIVRSGETGRKSFGTQPKRLIAKWFNDKPEEVVFRSSIGNNPTIGDVIKMVHPKPKDERREALFGYLTKRDYNADNLPDIVKAYEAFKKDPANAELPNLSFEMLAGLGLSKKQWIEIARKCTWTQARMNLNTFKRHGVLEDKETVRILAERIANPELIERAKAFPYQLMVSYFHAHDMPEKIRKALNEAVEISCNNVPVIEGQVYILPDVSGSMCSPVTGNSGYGYGWGRYGSQTVATCVDVAALMASAIKKRNPEAVIFPFDTRLHIKPNSFYNKSVLENARALAAFGGGGTYCSLPLEHMNKHNMKGSTVIYVSDNQSWVDTTRNGYHAYRLKDGTATLTQWNLFKERNPEAKMVCVDIHPYATTQAQSRSDILNVGGFSDRVFDVISIFLNSKNEEDHFINVIEENVQLG